MFSRVIPEAGPPGVQRQTASPAVFPDRSAVPPAVISVGRLHPVLGSCVHCRPRTCARSLKALRWWQSLSGAGWSAAAVAVGYGRPSNWKHPEEPQTPHALTGSPVSEPLFSSKEGEWVEQGTVMGRGAKSNRS